MWVNHAGKIGFVHIPRTGGATIKHMLGNMSNSAQKHHGWLKDIKHPKDYKDFYIFTVVRHPYQKYASEYHRRYKKTHNKGSPERPRRSPELQREAERHVESFHAYINHILDRGDSLLQLDYITHPFLKCKVYKFEDMSLKGIAEDVCQKSGYKRSIHKKHVHFEGMYDWNEWVDNDGVELINHYCRKDFDEFGYKRKVT